MNINIITVWIELFLFPLELFFEIQKISKIFWKKVNKQTQLVERNFIQNHSKILVTILASIFALQEGLWTNKPLVKP